MIYVKLGDVNWKIRFHHPVENGIRHIGTICEMRVAGSVEGPPIVAYANLHPKDRFCKETGRKIALTRALQMVGFDQAQRAQVWAVYFARKHQALPGWGKLGVL